MEIYENAAMQWGLISKEQATNAPATEAPVTEAPVTEAPSTDVIEPTIPVTQAPSGGISPTENTDHETSEKSNNSAGVLSFMGAGAGVIEIILLAVVAAVVLIGGGIVAAIIVIKKKK